MNKKCGFQDEQKFKRLKRTNNSTTERKYTTISFSSILIETLSCVASKSFVKKKEPNNVQIWLKLGKLFAREVRG